MMALHNKLGEKGEQLAVKYFIARGYRLLHVNWKRPPYEIDLLCERKGKLHVIEVKYRSSANFGPPEDAVTRKKLKSLFKAADVYLAEHPGYRHVQFDILSIIDAYGKPPAYFLVEDIYL